jgi:hypothetical protein
MDGSILHLVFMVTIEINGRKKSCPVCWEETTTRQYQQLKGLKDRSLIHVLSVLLGEAYDKVLESKSDELSTIMYQLVAYTAQQPEYFRDAEIPAVMHIGNRRAVYIPRDIGEMTIEQNFILRQAMTTVTYLEELIAKACAIFLQPQIDGTRFDAKRAEELEEEVGDLPIEETFPIGFFLLQRVRNFGRRGWLVWLLTRTRGTLLPKRLASWQKVNGSPRLQNYR